MILQGDCLARLREIPDESVHCCVTSPPFYGLRDYGFEGQIGLEKTPDEYVARLVEVFREVRRVLRADGVLWLNLGDSYAGSWGNAGGQNRGNGTQRPITRGSAVKDQAVRNGDFVPPGKYGFSSMGIKPKDLIGIPWRVAFALQADGWYLRKDIIWHKNNPMPESVTDRCTSSHEHIFHLTKSARYFYDNEAVKEPASRGRDYSKENRPIGGRKHRVSEGDINSRGGTGQYDRDWDSKDYGWAGTTRNRRDVWTISTKPYRGAHFATFPPKIPEICIKAGTSERGCCPVCGAPWVRVVERVPTYDNRPSPMERVRPCRGWGGLNATGSHNQTGTASQTLGFSPSCSCDAGEPVPCTVLDPFAGSGTTGAVAKSLGRDYILIEANPAYIPLIEARLAETKAPPRTTLEDF